MEEIMSSSMKKLPMKLYQKEHKLFYYCKQSDFYLLELNKGGERVEISLVFCTYTCPPNSPFLELKKHVLDVFLYLILTACTRDISLNFEAETIIFLSSHLI